MHTHISVYRCTYQERLRIEWNGITKNRIESNRIESYIKQNESNHNRIESQPNRITTLLGWTESNRIRIATESESKPEFQFQIAEIESQTSETMCIHRIEIESKMNPNGIETEPKTNPNRNETESKPNPNKPKTNFERPKQEQRKCLLTLSIIIEPKPHSNWNRTQTESKPKRNRIQTESTSTQNQS